MKKNVSSPTYMVLNTFLKNFWRRPFGVMQTALPSVTFVRFVIYIHTGDRYCTQPSHEWKSCPDLGLLLSGLQVPPGGPVPTGHQSISSTDCSSA